MKNEMPVFIYSMVPLQTTSYKTFFEAGPLKSLLENPGQLRSAGWDLTTNNHARIIKGDYIELTGAERKRIQVYEDGSLFVRVSADNDFLSWGLNSNNFREMPRLNTLALIEFSLNFCRLCSALTKHMEPQPPEVELKVEIRNAFFDKSKLFLIPHPVSTYGFAFTDDRHYAPEASTTRRQSVATEQLQSRPDVVAFLLVRQIFLWFGAAPDMIPYSSNEQNLKFIDENKIRNPRAL
ncbi:MAG: hypothetical protein WBD87_06150 [Candidatus Acidiferrales bacterium]